VSALVLLCPGIPGFPFPEEDADDPLAAEYERAHAAGDVGALADVMRQVWGRAGATQAVMEQLRSAARASISADDLQAEDPPVFGRLDEITVPAALMVGDADYPPIVEADRQAAALIPGCEFLFVPGMDHLPPLREPALVLDLITRTLARASW
jgi:3-oxoadipate enol-lactonase